MHTRKSLLAARTFRRRSADQLAGLFLVGCAAFVCFAGWTAAEEGWEAVPGRRLLEAPVKTFTPVQKVRLRPAAAAGARGGRIAGRAWLRARRRSSALPWPGRHFRPQREK